MNEKSEVGCVCKKIPCVCGLSRECEDPSDSNPTFVTYFILGLLVVVAIVLTGLCLLPAEFWQKLKWW